jgi:hypothetical protein
MPGMDTKQVSLDEGYAGCAQSVELLFCFHALGNGFGLQIAPQGDNRRYNRSAIGPVQHIQRERSIYLDRVEWYRRFV